MARGRGRFRGLWGQPFPVSHILPGSLPSSVMSRVCTIDCTGSARLWPKQALPSTGYVCWPLCVLVSSEDSDMGLWVHVQGGNTCCTSFFTAKKSVPSAWACLRSSQRSSPYIGTVMCT